MESFLHNRVFALVAILFLCFNCKNEEETKVVKENSKPELIMHQPSEMANFMNGMYAYNMQLRQQIINGETPVVMPLDLMKLHSAEMSNGHSRTPVWNSFVNVFIEAQQSVVDTLSNIELKERYNSAINNCLACHKTECTGPIPKIKKLLIK
ncbi:hypothetical protein [Winogradskyella sp.]|jgi:cytochrome c553|uniref:hypothetical protein n=1 Tax=Winogradskyella sp. TaxID=1883156 RepID=UPI0025CC49BB|nr:hypothetical protein [Winogradskyella sp.]MCT4630900.1 hypothetical protein [Winogradskyella sp.]